MSSQSFADLGVSAPLCAALLRNGIQAPFPIQSATLPDALAGRDVCGRAPTGSGKTLAFGLALISRVTKSTSGKPTSLILVPTRELAEQVRRELFPYLQTRGLFTHAIYGGMAYGFQIRALRRGVDVLVACPGRLEDLIQRGDLSLEDVGIVVLDEADRMADMGFLPAVRRILDQTRPDRQTMLFSATLDGEVDVVVRQYLTNPVKYEVERKDDITGDVRHVFWRTESAHERIDLTAALVERYGSTLIFCRTRHGAERVAKQLERSGVRAAAIHGDRTQNQRERALADFSRGHVPALVATDVAARGIHVDDLSCVVHFDPPNDHKDYLHRSGRTGRAGGDGTVVTLVDETTHDAVWRMQRRLGLSPRLDNPDLDAITSMEPAILTPDSGPVDRQPRRRGGGRPQGGQRDGHKRNPAQGSFNRPRAGVGGRASSQRGV